MPAVSIAHTARYRYPREGAFGEHRLFVRARTSYGQLVLAADLEITPKAVTPHWLRIRQLALGTAHSDFPVKESQRC
jgi:hypothetical protein